MVRWRAAAAVLALTAALAGACASRDDRPTAASHTVPPAAAANTGGYAGVADASPQPSQPGSSGPKKPSAPPSSAAPKPSKPPTSPPPAGPAPRSNTGTGTVALTFDDGPSPEYTPQILSLLKANGVKATFCLIGVNVQANPKLVRQIVREGHTLCNHSWSHDLHLGEKSPDEIRADMERTNAAIHAIVPDAPIRYFRHPGGAFTPASNEVARSLGMTPLSWSVDPKDWNKPGTEAIIAKVQTSSHPGSIVLSHDGGGDRSETIAAYQVLIPYLKQRFKLVAL